MWWWQRLHRLLSQFFCIRWWYGSRWPGPPCGPLLLHLTRGSPYRERLPVTWLSRGGSLGSVTLRWVEIRNKRGKHTLLICPRSSTFAFIYKRQRNQPYVAPKMWCGCNVICFSIPQMEQKLVKFNHQVAAAKLLELMTSVTSIH